jgi:hypothetical protein
MTIATVSLNVGDETARAFAAASVDDRRKLQLLLGLRLRELTVRPSRSLTAIMDEIGRHAESLGLTPDVLKSLLGDDTSPMTTRPGVSPKKRQARDDGSL